MTAWQLESYWCLVKCSVLFLGHVCLDFFFSQRNLIFLQHAHFRRLMNSQISSRIVKACRNKLQSVVHEITASWESFTEHLLPDGFILTGYSHSSKVGFYWIVSLNWGKTLKIDPLAVLWPLVLFSVRYPDNQWMIWEVWTWPCGCLVSQR